MEYLVSAAVIYKSIYRYSLTRIWQEKHGFKKVLFVGFNPDKGDARDDDPTIERCVELADAWGYGGMVLVNLFPFRSADPDQVRKHKTPNDIYAMNLSTIGLQMNLCDMAVACWGENGKFRDQATHFRALFPELKSLKNPDGGEPFTPLQLSNNRSPAPLVSARA